jgi:hypothetical protein
LFSFRQKIEGVLDRRAQGYGLFVWYVRRDELGGGGRERGGEGGEDTERGDGIDKWVGRRDEDIKDIING